MNNLCILQPKAVPSIRGTISMIDNTKDLISKVYLLLSYLLQFYILDIGVKDYIYK